MKKSLPRRSFSLDAFSSLVEISRPSQWVFLLLPFLLGATAGMTKLTSFVRPDFLVLVLFFLLPANFLLHGLQLWFSPTGSARSRSFYKEKEVPPITLSQLGQGLLLVGVFFGLLLLLLAPGPGSVLFCWLIAVLIFTMPPFRLMERPFFDVYTSFLFVLPAIAGWWWATLEPPTMMTTLAWGLLAAGWKMLQMTAEQASQKGKEKRTGSLSVFDESQALFFVFAHWLLFAFWVQDGSWLARLAFFVPLTAVPFLVLPRKSVRLWYPLVLVVSALLIVLVFGILLLRLIV
jgi:hypothetical protein